MAWLAIDKSNRESIHEYKPTFDTCEWCDEYERSVEGEYFIDSTTIYLPKGTIAKILGRVLTFEESPIEITD